MIHNIFRHILTFNIVSVSVSSLILFVSYLTLNIDKCSQRCGAKKNHEKHYDIYIYYMPRNIPPLCQSLYERLRAGVGLPTSQKYWSPLKYCTNVDIASMF